MHALRAVVRMSSMWIECVRHLGSVWVRAMECVRV